MLMLLFFSNIILTISNRITEKSLSVYPLISRSWGRVSPFAAPADSPPWQSVSSCSLWSLTVRSSSAEVTSRGKLMCPWPRKCLCRAVFYLTLLPANSSDVLTSLRLTLTHPWCQALVCCCHPNPEGTFLAQFQGSPHDSAPKACSLDSLLHISSRSPGLVGKIYHKEALWLQFWISSLFQKAGNLTL